MCGPTFLLGHLCVDPHRCEDGAHHLQTERTVMFQKQLVPSASLLLLVLLDTPTDQQPEPWPGPPRVLRVRLG